MTNKLIFCLAFLLMQVKTIYADQVLTFKDALSQHLISSNMYGLVGGSHEGQSIDAEIVNRSGKVISIKVDAGQTLLPSDSVVQSMMVTEDLMVMLEPGKTVKVKFYAYCIENSDAGPGVKDTFFFGPKASGALLSVAQFLNDKKYHGAAAQDFIWCVSDGADINNIVAEDEKMTNEMRQLVASVSKQTYEPYKAAVNPIAQKYVLRTTRTIADPFKLFTGGVSLQAPPGTAIRIVLVDELGKELRELYNVNSGNSSVQLDFPFELDGRTLENKIYYVRYYIGNQKVRDIPVNNKGVTSFRF